MTVRNNKHPLLTFALYRGSNRIWLLLLNTKKLRKFPAVGQLFHRKTGPQPQAPCKHTNDNKLSGFSYQDVPFQKKTGLDGDADAGLAVTLNIAAKKKQDKTFEEMLPKAERMKVSSFLGYKHCHTMDFSQFVKCVKTWAQSIAAVHCWP